MKLLKELWKPFLTKEKTLILVTVFILINITIWTNYQQSILSSPQYRETFPPAGLEFFYQLFRIGTNPFLFMIMMLLLPNLMSYDFLSYQQSHASYPIETRITKRNYYFNVFIKNIVMTFFTVLIMIILIACIVHFFYAPLQFNSMNYPQYYYATAQILSSNEIISFVGFIILTSLGYALISSLLFSLQVIITNKYIYRCCGVMVGILLVLIPALIQGFLLFPDLAFLLQINNLVALGMENVRANPFALSHMMLYVISFLIYGCLSYFAYRFMLRWREHYD